MANRENLRFAKANNQAIAVATSKYVLLLNSDTIMYPGMVEGLLSFMESHPGSAVVGPKIINPDGSLQSKGGPLPSVASTVLQLCGAHRSPFCTKVFPNFCWSENDTRKVGCIW